MTTHVDTQIKALVFDFGGVLMDWNPRHLYRRFFENDPDGMEQFLTEIGFAEWNMQQDRGRPFSVAVAQLSAQFPHRADLIRAFDEHWDESIAGTIQPTVEILQTLRQAGYPLYGLSNWSAETFQRVRHKYEFFNLFDLILLSGEVELVKPDPEIYQRLLHMINRPAEECLFIDDSQPNIETANRLGFKTIHFTSPEHLAAELQRLHVLP